MIPKKETRKENSGCQELVEGIQKWVQSFSPGWQKSLEMDNGNDCTTMRIYFMPLNCTL